MSLQSCPTLCNPIDGSPPGSPVPGILQARTLEWVAISFSNVWKWKVKGKSLSRVQLFATPWTTAYQAPPSMGFSRQEYWSRVPWEIQLIFLCETWQSHWILWKALLCTRVQSCSSLCNPVDCSPPASSVHFMLMDFLCKRLYHLEIMMVSFLLFHFLPSSCFLS